jgi:hypothetical protein
MRYGTQYGPDITFLGVDRCSVDVDVCDPGHAPGTGTPEPGGLTARQLLDSVRRIAYELPVLGLDVVEVSPPYDHAEITSFLANRVALEALSGIARRRRDARDGITWTAASRYSMTARARAEALPAEAVEFPVPDAAEEGVPLVRREHQDRPSGVSAVANADLAAWQARHLDAVAVGVAQGALDPVRTRTRPFAPAAERSASHVTPSIDGVFPRYAASQPGTRARNTWPCR